MSAPQRILAIHVARIGDTLLTTAALRHLGELYPNAQIDFLGHSKRVEVLEHLPYLQHLGSISKRTARLKGWLSGLFGKKPYDLAFVWGHDAELISYARRVSKRLIVSRQRNDAVNAIADLVVDFPNDTNLIRESEDKPLSQWILDIVEQGTASKAINIYPDYVVTKNESSAAQALLNEHGIEADSKLIGLVIESHPAGSHRDWPIENFELLVQRLHRFEQKTYFVLIGSKLPEAKVRRLKNILGEHLIVLSGLLTLRESAAVIDKLDLFISVDTGPAHIAAALGTPSIIMFHCMRAGRYLVAPRLAERVTIIDHPQPRCKCNFDSAMADIAVDQVYDAAIHRMGVDHG